VPALKDHLDESLIEVLAAELRAAWTGFPVEGFVARATSTLLELELKARVALVADALDEALPEDDAELIAVLDAALRSASFDGWMTWPCAELVGRRAPHDPERYLPLMARLTGRSTCEFAIRGCIERHPELTFGFLERWVEDPDEHVRRLVSEGTRPRLPWGARLRELQADPRPSIALLDRLRDDPSPYVRRSVANHLGDIVKDHPDLAVATATRWRSEGGTHVHEVIRHGLRTLIKAGHPDALKLIGYDPDAEVVLRSFGVTPERLAIGGQAAIEATLVVDGDREVPVVVEYVIRYLGAKGPRKPKAYRLAERVAVPGEVVELRRRQTFAHASIRTLHPGEQGIDLQVNGRVLGSVTIHLIEA
jgi:3-methyladenine DNA glycosylase AlkC